jgi:hypothetical protein
LATEGRWIDAVKKARKKLEFHPTRGGDGGTAPKPLAEVTTREDRLGTRRWTYRNSAVFPTGAHPDDTLPTLNPFDRAHDLRDNDREPKLFPAATRKRGMIVSELLNTTPRQYLKGDFHTPLRKTGTNPDGSPVVERTRVHYEEVFDATHELEQWLKSEGLDVERPYRHEHRDKLIRLTTPAQFRNFTEPRTHVWKD